MSSTANINKLFNNCYKVGRIELVKEGNIGSQQDLRTTVPYFTK